MGEREPVAYEGIPLPIPLPASGTIVIHLQLGGIHMRILDAFSHAPLAGRAYVITGAAGKTFTGTTDAQGTLRHRDVPLDEYALALDGIVEGLRAVLLDSDDPEPLVRFVGGARRGGGSA